MKDPVDVRASQIRKILESNAFRNTEVLKRLLDYLARQALDNPGGELKEYTVGIEAFGKPPDYDPKTDSSVRVQAGKLRQKLDEYYRTEGAAEPIVIELPKGHFKIEFRPREAPVEPIAMTRPAALKRPAVAALAFATLALGVLVWWQFRTRPAAGERWNSEMEEFWRPFATSPRPIMAAVGSPLFAKIGNSFFRDPSLNTWDAAKDSVELRVVTAALNGTQAAPAFPYTGVGEAAGAFELQRLLLPHGRDLALRTSSQLTWEDISRCNMIFLGPPKFNLQTMDLPVRQDFEISHGRVQNLHPAAGEPKTFEEKWTPDRTSLEEGHALISRLPGLHRSGEMLILGGSSTESTRAAVEFVTRPEYVTAFVRWMRQQPGGVPQWFQAVIRARFKSQTPIEIDRVAFHALK